MAAFPEDVTLTPPFERAHVTRLAEMALTIGIGLHTATIVALPHIPRLMAYFWTLLFFALAATIPMERYGGKREMARRLLTLLAVLAGALMLSPESGLWVWVPAAAFLNTSHLPGKARRQLVVLVAALLWLLVVFWLRLDVQSALFWLLVAGGLLLFLLYVQEWFDLNEIIVARYQLLQAALNFTPDSIAVKDTQGRYLLTNRTMRNALRADGYDPNILGKTAYEAFAPAGAAQISETDHAVMEQRQVVTATQRWLDPNGRERWDLVTKAPLFDPDGQLVAVVGTSRDITDLKRREETAARERNLLQLVLDNTPLTIVALDANGAPLLANKTARRGWLEEFPDSQEGFSTARFFFSTEIYRRWLKHQYRVISQGGIGAPTPTLVEVVSLANGHGETEWRQVRFVPIFTPEGEYAGVLSIAEDVTQRAVMQAALEYQATHDSMTGLPNRRLLLGQIGDALAQYPRPALGVLFCDLDQFKWVNDSLGHDTGDRLLQAVAERFAAPLEEHHTLIRIGGDEFVVLMEKDGTVELAQNMARRLLHSLAEPVELDGMRFALGVSIGVAVLRPDHERAEDLIRDADIAMYRAKELGGNEVALFDEGLRARVQRRLALSQSLRDALAAGALEVYYQPKVLLEGAVLSGFEALARWHDGERGWISPEEFVRVAEETGQISRLGEWILRAACRQFCLWARSEPERLGDLTLCVNVSVYQLQEEGFADLVAQIIAEEGIDPSRLFLEITETALISYAEHTLTQFSALKRLGVQLAVDDFGTGYSSLGYLRSFPIDVLKLDRSLIADIDRDSESRVIVQKVIELAIALNIDIVAEGVERLSQVTLLRQLGCRFAQGFIYAPPLPPEEAARWGQPLTLN